MTDDGGRTDADQVAATALDMPLSDVEELGRKIRQDLGIEDANGNPL